MDQRGMKAARYALVGLIVVAATAIGLALLPYGSFDAAGARLWELLAL